MVGEPQAPPPQQTYTAQQIAEAQAREAAGKQAAEAQNTGYRNNTLPVLPRFAEAPQEQVIAYDTTRLDAMGRGTPYYISSGEDAAREAAKHERLFHPYEFYGQPDTSGMTLSQIEARYGYSLADAQQEYYRKNPSPRAQAITAQYNTTKGIVENPYGEDTAAGIAWTINRGGGTVGMSLGGKAYREGYDPIVSTAPDINTEAIRDLSSASSLPLTIRGGKTVAGYDTTGITTFVPYGEYRQIAIENSKLLLSETGEVGIYQYDPRRDTYGLISGGGRAALQSGMFTIYRPETSAVFTQVSGGSKLSPYGDAAEAEAILANPKAYSRLGAEAYAGFVRPLDNRTLTPEDAFSRYGNWNNLANFVDPQGANKGKAELPGADIPWSIQKGSPTIQYMDKGGIIPGSAVDLGGGITGRLVGGKTVASVATTEDIAGGALPRPFASTYQAPAPQGFVEGIGSWFAGAERTFGQITGFSNLPEPTTEQIKGMAPALAAVPGATPVGIALMTPGVSDYAASYIKGETTGLKERPLQTALSFGTGIALGGVFKGAEFGMGVARASVAEKAISQGGVYRGAEIFAANALPVGGKILAGVYSTDVGLRATNVGRDFSPAAAERFGGIVATEVRPMAVGAVIGSSAATTSVEKIRVSELNRQGTGAGVVEYYGAQPLKAAALEVKAPITRQIDLVKLEYPQFVEEGKGPLQYASYKLGFEKTPTYIEPTRATVAPEQEFLTGSAYGEQTRFYDVINAATKRGNQFEPTTLKYEPYEYSQIDAYGKQLTLSERVGGIKSWFNTVTMKGTQAEPTTLDPTLNTAETWLSLNINKVYPKEPIGMKIDAYFEENPITAFDNLSTNLFRPTMEISNINRRSTYNLQEVFAGTKQKGISTLNIFGKPAEAPAKRVPFEYQKPGVEVKSGNGATSIVRVEEVAAPIRPIQTAGVEFDIRGLPQYPKAPSPFSKGTFVVEEELRYYRLPPGMVSPGPKEETIQNVFQIPESISGLSQEFMQVPRTKATPDFMSRIREQGREYGKSSLQVPRITPAITPSFTPGVTPTTTPRTTPIIVPLITPTTTPVTTPFITPITTPITTPVTTPQNPPYTPPRYPDIPIVPPLGPGIPTLPYLGGGGYTSGRKKARRSFLEVFNMGLDIAGPIMKLSSPPKPRKATKTGGSKAAKAMRGGWSRTIKAKKKK